MTSLSRVHRAKRIRDLNDEFRGNPDTVAATEGFLLLFGKVTMPYFVEQVRTYDRFTPGDDYAEHDSGAFEVHDYEVCWRIDYVAPTLDGPSRDPADRTKTRRVLRFMLAEELAAAA